MKYMLKKKYVDYLGTDIHCTSQKSIIHLFSKIEKKIKKITGDEYYSSIMKNNDSLIL